MPVKITEADLQAVLPDLTTTMRFPGIREPVEMYRDRWGIPHIKAENENDLFFAQGFVTAQDRLWHMDADRHRALGRWRSSLEVAVSPKIGSYGRREWVAPRNWTTKSLALKRR